MTEYEEKMQEVYRNTNKELIEILKEERKTSLYTQIALIVCVLLMSICTMICFSNVNNQWLEYESQFETISVDTTDGNANYIGESGCIRNGIN